LRTRFGALILVALLLAGCGLLPQETEEVTIDVAAPVVTQRETVTVTRDSIDSRITLNVAFGAEQQQSLYTRSSGRIRHLYVTPGQQVAAGALLLEVEPGNLHSDIELAEMDLQSQVLTLERALARKGFVDAPTEADVLRYENNIRTAEIKVERLQTQLADQRIYAPFSGQVVTVSAAEGGQADAYKEMILMAAAGQPVGRVTVDDQTAAALRVGQAVSIFPNDGDATPIAGTVKTVPLVGGQNRTLIIGADADSPRLQVGRNGRIEIILDAKEDALIVPQSAIRMYGGRTFVTVVDGESRQEVAIQIGLENEQYAEVLEGLREGQRVVGR
jgi:RND family efflux transporter MFP subunit